jgi:hypothetical protein
MSDALAIFLVVLGALLVMAVSIFLVLRYEDEIYDWSIRLQKLCQKGKKEKVTYGVAEVTTFKMKREE